MYHYIRNFNKKFPYYNNLEINTFKKQIKKFSEIGIADNKNEIYSYNSKIILTFDDALKDHLWAAEELNKNQLIGLFFVPTLPFKNNDILDVHKTHLIVGKVGGIIALKELKKYLHKKNLTNFFNTDEKIKYKMAYSQNNDQKDKREFKKIMNYYGNIKIKHNILNHLLKVFNINAKAKDYYLSKKEIKYMSELGMIIGSHAESHSLLSRLSFKNQLKEIRNSKNLLEKITRKECDTFCYPYGSKISYNNDTLTVLKKLKFKIGYSVKPRDISKNDYLNKPFELPRYDCNLFL